ncbi:hypothetical protein HJC23_004555 [Cyclotella cryptica]|uniref:PDZ domain-containing protein n=1 Tax=Cyclotella cryptica TaxID=29204 RepID=A0ABD3QAX5_9STRA|eukprot:CCRYP_007295-RA/>CCRYP_007295-RA protein AED:0.03 eAED:0.03 QI:150/1/1/1/1/1/2/484/324
MTTLPPTIHEHNIEEDDTFVLHNDNNINNNDDDDSPPFLFDPSSMDLVRDTASPGTHHRGSSRSAATTQLASDVGSVMLGRANPFLKSVTFFDPEVYYRRKEEDGDSPDANEDDDDPNVHSDEDATVNVNDLTHWDIQLADPPNNPPPRGLFSKLARVNTFKKPKQLIVHDFEGLIEFSSLRQGDSLVSINKRRISAEEYSADEAMQYMRTCLENDGVLFVTTENPEGKDILINITIIKPKPEMTYQDLGLIVWNWPLLVVREIKENSIFQHTALRETDQIAAINDIDCSRMKEKEFAVCVGELEREITLTVLRRKHRYTGSYN